MIERCIIYIMMKRSQIYLPMEQWRFLGILSHQMHRSISELIRQALDRVYKPDARLDFKKSLSGVAGLWERRSLPPTHSYVRRLRRGTRLKSF